MATPEQINDLVALYAGYFNRAPDPEGLQFWIDQIDGGREFNTIAADFAASEEATALYPYLTTPDVATPSTFITSIYQNLFNRAPEPEGLQFWTDVLESGSVSVADMIEAIINGAVDAPDATPPTFDATTLENKIEVGRDFAQDAANTSGFEFDAEAKSAAIAAIDGVTNDEATVVAAKAATDAYLSGEANEGETSTLTTGVDDINGTADNDIINALTVNATTGEAASTLTSFDDIDGGAGTDTLNIYTAFDGDAEDEGADQNAGFPAMASVKNVEIVNVLNGNEGVASLADASNYTGVEQLWQVNAAADVTNLEATTTAGLRGVTATAADALTINAEEAATSASIALENLKGDKASGDGAVQNQAVLSVKGDALTTVNVSGSLAQAATGATAAAASLALDVTLAEDAQAATVNTGVATTLTIENADSSTEELTSIDASASTGDITYAGDTAVSNLQTGSGDDTVTLNTTFSDDVTSASVETGAGDDEITLAATNAGDVTADAGAGDDTVNVAAIDDLSTDSSVDGGEGTDTLAITGNGAVSLVAEDYTLLNAIFSNFEELSFAGAATFDASRLADYKSFTLEAGGTVTEVADDQAITTGGDLNVTAAGYDATGSATVYAGNLNVTANGGEEEGIDSAPGDRTTVTAQAESIELTAAATEDDAAAVTLDGDVKEATINVNTFVDEATETFNGASVVVETATATDAVTETDDQTGETTVVTPAEPASLASMTTLTLTGNGSASVTNGEGTALITVDASALNSVNAEGKAAAGLNYNSSNAAAETVTLGDGLDDITLGASTVAKTDTIVGFNLATNEAGEFDENTSDDLDFMSLGDDVEAIGEIEADSLDLALIDAIAEGDEVNGIIFDFDGDTYVYQSANDVVDDGDALVKLAGGVDQDLLDDMFAA